MIGARQAASLRREADAIKQEWGRGGEPDAREALGRQPELRADRSVVLDLAYEEYCLRCEAGAPPDPDAFCDRFPTYRQSLRVLIVGHQYLAANVAALADAPPVRWPEPGEQLGDLTVLRELGRGGFGRVYLATEESTGGRPVAVKLSPDGAAEARTMGRLTHPHIVPVLSARFEEAAGMTAVRMPFFGAATLTDVLEQAYPTADSPPPVTAAVVREALRAAGRSDDPAPLPSGASGRLETGAYTDVVARLALQIAEALAFLHKEGVVHCDLKPSNVLLSPSGQALLLDFNLSADARAAASRLGGTLPYMAPEQLRALFAGGKRGEGDAAPDARVDLFALGVMAYELLTGKHPFGAPSAGLSTAVGAAELLERQAKGFGPLRTLNPAVDRRLARLIEACLAFDPTRRPATAATAAAQLRSYLSPLARLGRLAARRPWVTAAAAGMLLLAVGGGIATAASQDARAVWEYKQGRQAYLAGDYAAAREHFDRAVQNDPTGDSAYLLARAEAELRVGEGADGDPAETAFRDAYLDFEILYLRNKQDGEMMARMGYCESRRGDAAAVGWYDQAVEAHFESAGLYNDLAYTSMKNNQADAALENLRHALQLDPDLQAAHYNRALMCLDPPSGKPAPIPPAALADMEQAIRIGPASPELYLNAARLYAAAARDAEPAERNRMDDAAIGFLQKGLACGLDPRKDNVGGDPYLGAILGSSLRFQDLLTATPLPASPRKNLRLIDPAPFRLD